jgi:molybdenum cofactor guanylyltransferase
MSEPIPVLGVPVCGVTVGIILAGGLSRRMFEGAKVQGDKALLELGDGTLLDAVIERLARQVDQMVINANGDPKRFEDYGLPVVRDTVAGFVGPLAGVLAGMRWAKAHAPGATHILTVSADAPFLPTTLVDTFSAALAGRSAGAPNGIAIAKSADGLHPVIGLWPVALADDLEGALGSGVRKVLDWTDKHGTVPVHFGPTTVGGEQIDPFFNANTPDELRRARALMDAEDADV